MRLSSRAQKIKASPISEVFDRANKLREAGADLIDFSVGEPDFETSSNIRMRAQKAIDEGHTRYTAVSGTAALKSAIMSKFEREQGLSFNSNEIVVGSGAKSVLYAAIQAVINKGDEAILPLPAWPSHRAMIELSEGVVKPLVTGIETGFKVNAHQLEAAITPKTRLLIISSPSNPTGAVYTHKELGALAEILRKYPDIAVISDDLYEHILYDDKIFTTLSQIAPDLRDRILTVNGVSKGYAMTGWRIGFAAGPQDWIKAIGGFFSQMTGSPNAIAQEAAIEALTGDQSSVRIFGEAYQERRDVFCDVLRKSPHFQFLEPDGAFYVFVGILGLGERTSVDFCNMALEKGVVLTPGEAFEAPGFFRASIATSTKNVEEGAKRIVKAANIFFE